MRHARSLADHETPGGCEVSDIYGIRDWMSLPASRRSSPGDPAREMFVEKGLKQRSPILLNLGILIADTDVDPCFAFRKEPAVQRRDQRVEDHLDLVWRMLELIPPSHDGLQVANRTSFECKPRLGSICDDRERGFQW